MKKPFLILPLNKVSHQQADTSEQQRAGQHEETIYPIMQGYDSISGIPGSKAQPYDQQPDAQSYEQAGRPDVPFGIFLNIQVPLGIDFFISAQCIGLDGRFRTVVLQRETLKSDVNSE